MRQSLASHRRHPIRRPVETDFYDEQGREFPKLTRGMVQRAARYGHRQTVDGGEYLYRVGERNVDLFIILDGEVDILESDGRGGHTLVTTHQANQFTGELDQLSGRAVLVCAKVARPTTVLRIPRSAMLSMVRAESDIAEIMMRAFILRRARLQQNAEGGTLILGSEFSADCLRIQSFLLRNGYPHRLIDTDKDPDAREALKLFHINEAALPVVVVEGQTSVSRPTNRDLAEILGIAETFEVNHVYDVVVVGAGPAGLAAAVYSASEGLDTIVVEAFGPGGQAGTSSRIENYLGFPLGVSGQGLASRAQVQAQRFGARLVVARAAKRLECTDLPFEVELDDGKVIASRSVVVASGARYRRLDVPGIEQFEGQGVHYAATALEGKLCAGSEAIVVGGGNSAGQAAVYLSARARHVHILVRGEGLSDTMSDYLVQRIMQSSSITLHTRCSVTALEGNGRLEQVRWTCDDGREVVQPAANLFLMIGAVPNTDWLAGCVDLDRNGFVVTAPGAEEMQEFGQYATSKAGIFAVGDARSRSVKRVASSVGEGSVVVHSIHSWLASLQR
ncbi:FAD-dependent oxidoreductase [Rhizobium leguminosarum]|uniref:FAD-dependent oxidoreductase n=1 Tax=Rhizobium leguminosarum TaxID=384 RepID=UPI003F9C88B4